MLKKYAEVYFKYISEQLKTRKSDLSNTSVPVCLVASEFSKISGTWLNLYTGIKKNENELHRIIFVTSGITPYGAGSYKIVYIDQDSFIINNHSNDAELIAAAEFIHSNTDAWHAGFSAIWFNSLTKTEQESVLSDTLCYSFASERFLDIIKSNLEKNSDTNDDN